jgi:AraC family transcriptional regulator
MSNALTGKAVEAASSSLSNRRVEHILESPYGLRQRCKSEAIASPVAATILQALVRDLQAGSSAGALVGDSLIVALLAHLNGAAPAPLKGIGRLAPAVCKRILAYMDEQLAAQVTLAELADLARTSVRHFCRSFQASTGCSPHQHLLRQRVERAKSLMAESRMSMAEIAQFVGFSDQSQFTRTFKRHTGTTPTAYRTGN